MFALLTHEPKGLLIWCASKPERDGLLEANPTAFSTSRHYAGQPTLLIDLPEVGHDELVELITESWLARAPERLTRDWEPGD